MTTTRFYLYCNRTNIDLVETPKPKLNPCPTDCECSWIQKSINCRGRNLEEIPKNLPQFIIRIDLSDNSIETLGVNDFRDCPDLNEIILDNNRLTVIDKQPFSTLKKLRRLSLASNGLVELQRDLIWRANKLTSLVLDNNPIHIPTDLSLFNSTKLEDLSMVGCNVTELYDETFSGLTQLKTLNLTGNLLDVSVKLLMIKLSNRNTYNKNFIYFLVRFECRCL